MQNALTICSRPAKKMPRKLTLMREYAALCCPNVPVTSLLFGDDLQQQLNNIKASNKILLMSVNVNKSQKAGYKDSSSTRGQHRSSDQYYKRSFHSHNHWKNRGDKSKNFKSPSSRTRRGTRTKGKRQGADQFRNPTG